MNDRIQKLISLLLKEPDITITEVMHKLSLTRRQVNYAIGIINSELESRGIDPIRRYRDGTFKFNSEITNLLKEDHTSNSKEYKDEERRALISVYLLYNLDYVSLRHLTDFLGYSRTTVVSDIRNLESLLKQYSIGLTYDRIMGYHLQGSEENILRFGAYLIINYADILSLKFSKDFIDRKISHKATAVILEIENHFKSTFSDRYFEILRELIEMILVRANIGDFKEELDPLVISTKEYKFLREYPLLNKLDDQRIKWISLEILSSNVYDKTNTDFGIDELQILRFVHEIVEGFKAKTIVEIDDQRQFEIRLLNHIRPACYRVKYNLPSLGVVDTIVDSNHEILEQIIRELLSPLEKWLGTSFPINEIRLLTYYFGYQLVNDHDETIIPKIKYKAVVVCSNGIILSNILIEKLREIFPEINFVLTMSAREFNNSAKDIDVVFSTIPLDTSFPQYLVGPDMSYSDKISLRYRVLKDLGIEKTDSQVNQIVELFEKYAEINDSSELKNKIKHILLSKPTAISNQKKLPNLLVYLKPNYIQVIDRKLEWHEALATALAPLEKNKVVEKRYYHELAKQIDNKNNYSFLGKYIAIPHSSPKNGILDDGISMLISKEPIKLPFGRKVRIIAPIAFYNMDRYVRAINQFASLATNDQLIEKLLATNKTSEAYEIIKTYIEKEEGQS